MGGLDRRGGRHRSATAVVAVMLASVVACGGGEDDRLPSPRSPQPTPVTASPTLSLTPEEQQAVDEVRALFDEFMNAYVELATSGEVPNEHPAYPTLDQHRLWSGDLLEEVVDDWRGGQTLSGALSWEFIGVSAIDLSHTTEAGARNPLLHLTFCVDAADWRQDGSATTRDERHLWTIEASWLDQRGGPETGGWRLASRLIEDDGC